jgi:hypothetical protein
MTPSLSLKFIGKSILEGALFASATFQAFKFIVASTFIANFQMIVDLFFIPNCEGACAVPITHYYSGTSTTISLPQSLDSSTTRTDELPSLPLSLAIQQNPNSGKAWLLTKNPIKTSG